MSSGTSVSLVLNKTPGVHTITGHGGGGYTSWYIFRSEDQRLYLIFATFDSEGYTCSWRQIRGTIDEPFEETVVADSDDYYSDDGLPVDPFYLKLPAEGIDGEIDGMPLYVCADT